MILCSKLHQKLQQNVNNDGDIWIWQRFDIYKVNELGSEAQQSEKRMIGMGQKSYFKAISSTLNTAHISLWTLFTLHSRSARKWENNHRVNYESWKNDAWTLFNLLGCCWAKKEEKGVQKMIGRVIWRNEKTNDRTVRTARKKVMFTLKN